MAPEVKVSEEELDAALGLLVDTRYSYYFPNPFELEAILHSWDPVRQALGRTNLLSYRPHRPLELIAPKSKYAVRPIQLLDPVDLIHLSALVLRLAPEIEAVRPAISERKVHSFRLNRKPDGRFEFKSDWKSWAQEVQNHLDSHPMAARADIVDFFPRVYLHRLENALVALTQKDHEVRAVMGLLEACSHGTSYGIPVGPVACNLLAEALLVEVDDFLSSQGVVFARYIDDYLLFGSSEADCLRGLYALAQRLHNTQGLSLNMAKTKVMKTENLAKELLPPEDPNSLLRERIIETVFGGDPYAEIDPERLTPEQKRLIDQLDSRRMLELSLEGDLVDLKAVRFVLNVLAGLKRAEHLELILCNLDRLLAASDTIARMVELAEVDDARLRREVGARILRFIREGHFVPDYQAVWLLEPFVSSGKWGCLADLRAIAREHRNPFVRRQAILALGHLRDRSALLDLKSCVDDAKDWEWRAIIYSCRGLPADESRAFWQAQGIEREWKTENAVTKATLEFARSTG